MTAPVDGAFDAASGIATITIQRPEVRNAIDVVTAQALHAAVVSLTEQSGLRCVVLRGAGRAFVAGGDLQAFAADFDRAGETLDALLDGLEPVVRTLRRIDAPVLAVVHGAVAGAGLSLMAAADLVLAAEGTRFVCAYDRIAAAPDCGGSYFLPRLMGARRASELMLLGDIWDARAAHEAGLINRVVAEDELDATAAEWAARLAAGPTRAYGHWKRLSDAAFGSTLDAQLAAEREAFRDATTSADFREGVGAFLEGREAHFAGR
ncbi:enoyl-CoA hydratase-related protein [Algiphilus sp.]|uniref:enoyl-CoA hydratase/isomerase family protein n=1 Tax=Algiphilus sp. TaxID=1872431 RepID=UPI0025B94701|nr:enoyl-CoA hydratase-related protein [Algiphilus sp.]MCK5771150.1 enoyl-CoA hydratase/isomerase family protein [Algiphilus sp.]